MSTHLTTTTLAADPKGLRVFQQTGQVVWFLALEDESSEILQEDKKVPGGYKEVGIEPNTTGYHNISCLLEDNVVWLQLHRGVAFIMGSPNNTGKSDEWFFTRLEAVVNHIDSLHSGNYSK